MTQSGKTGVITHDSRYNFSPSYNNNYRSLASEVTNSYYLQADQPLEVAEKKEAHNPKANHIKPSNSKELQKIIQRWQEKVAEWHQKEREALNTQSLKESCEDSVATPSVKSVDECMYNINFYVCVCLSVGR